MSTWSVAIELHGFLKVHKNEFFAFYYIGEAIIQTNSGYQDVIRRIITEDAAWIYAYDPETTDQASEYHAKGEPRLKRQKSSDWDMVKLSKDYLGGIP